MVHMEYWRLREHRRLQEESTVRSESILLPFLRFSDFPLSPLSPNIEKLQGLRHPEREGFVAAALV